VPVTPPRPGRARSIVLDPADPLRLVVGVEVGGVVLSEDGGRTWTMNRPGGNPDLHNIVAKPDEPGVLFASTGFGRIDRSEPMEQRIAGMFRSDDHGKSWRFPVEGPDPALHTPALHRSTPAPRGHGGLVAHRILGREGRGRREGDALSVRRRRRDVALAR
jgi:photosystem II stability/assembly factor-like uncharacterized protein